MRELADQFAIYARLYAEAVVAFTRNPATMSPEKYIRLKAAVEDAQRRAEMMGIAYEDHIDSHRCGAV
jgi:hypothetical protein